MAHAKHLKWLLIPAVLVLAAGCTSIKGYTVDEKQDYVLKMRNETLRDLYEKQPSAKDHIRGSAGYAVFSSVGVKIFFFGSGNGFGVAHDNKTRKNTYMRMFTGGIGLGLGVKDYRLVIVFDNKVDLDKFIEEGWDFSGSAEASAKRYDDGGTLSVAKSVNLDITMYTITKAGLSLEAMIEGTKFWKVDELNP